MHRIVLVLPAFESPARFQIWILVREEDQGRKYQGVYLSLLSKPSLAISNITANFPIYFILDQHNVPSKLLPVSVTLLEWWFWLRRRLGSGEPTSGPLMRYCPCFGYFQLDPIGKGLDCVFRVNSFLPTHPIIWHKYPVLLQSITLGVKIHD